MNYVFSQHTYYKVLQMNTWSRNESNLRRYHSVYAASDDICCAARIAVSGSVNSEC